eukprot:TRINITY_DN12106_c0_g1_i3.p1 TRINITY_DN12106_c0_g1~~TRINITY_DN12106_c0_g1_i3.p1  ORF type:complete len:139 (+),score=21.21 TRINITY_DN12106_c0_g1_i3:95-511(+)
MLRIFRSRFVTCVFCCSAPSVKASWTRSVINLFSLGRLLYQTVALTLSNNILDTMMRVGGAEPGMRTMIDVLLPVSEALLAGKSNGEICAIAKEKADATAQITSTNFGRSQYLNEESLAGTKDPGCAAAALAIGAIAS